MRAILFDFGGTLDYPRHWLDRFLAHYRAAGIAIDRAELDLAYGAATRTAYASGARLREYGLEELVEYLVGLQVQYLHMNGPIHIREILARTATSEIRGQTVQRISGAFVAESREGLARSRRVLMALSKRFRIGLVSNFYGNLDRVAAEAGLTEFIDGIADSGRLGIYKPDPRIFDAALAQLGVSPAQTTVVGDSLIKDCAPAKRLGMRSVWLRHREFAGRPCDEFVDFIIDSLPGLEHLEWDEA